MLNLSHYSCQQCMQSSFEAYCTFQPFSKKLHFPKCREEGITSFLQWFFKALTSCQMRSQAALVSRKQRPNQAPKKKTKQARKQNPKQRLGQARPHQKMNRPPARQMRMQKHQEPRRQLQAPSQLWWRDLLLRHRHWPPRGRQRGRNAQPALKPQSWRCIRTSTQPESMDTRSTGSKSWLRLGKKLKDCDSWQDGTWYEMKYLMYPQVQCQIFQASNILICSINFFTAQLKSIPGLSDEVREVIVAPKLKVGKINLGSLMMSRHDVMSSSFTCCFGIFGWIVHNLDLKHFWWTKAAVKAEIIRTNGNADAGRALQAWLQPDTFYFTLCGFSHLYIYILYHTYIYHITHIHITDILHLYQVKLCSSLELSCLETVAPSRSKWFKAT